MILTTPQELQPTHSTIECIDYISSKPSLLLRTIRIIFPITRSYDYLTFPKSAEAKSARLYSNEPAVMLGTLQVSTNGRMRT